MNRLARHLPLLLLLFFTGCSGSWEEEKVDAGYKGEARRNRFLAMERFAREMHLRVEDRRILGRFPFDDSSAIMVSGETLAIERTARQALDWVKSGGHLIFVLRYAKPEITGKTKKEREAAEAVKTVIETISRREKNAFLDLMKVTVQASPPASDFKLDEKVLRLVTPSPTRGFQPDANHRRQGLKHSGKADKPVDKQSVSFLSMTEGLGRVTFLSDNLCWRNDQIGQADHARFLQEVLDLNPVDHFIVVQEDRGSFLALLWAYGWMPLVAGLVWLAFWLWNLTHRFGPLAFLRDVKERQFAKHLRQAGTLLWRHGHADQLLDTQRERIRRELARKEFQGQEPKQLYILCEALARRTGLPLEEINEVMSGDSDGPFLVRKNSQGYLKTFRSLQRLEQLI